MTERIKYDATANEMKHAIEKLKNVDELQEPFTEGNWSGRTKRDELHKDRGNFWEDVSNTESLRKITNGNNLEGVFGAS